VKKLRELNIEVIDAQKTFDEIYQGTHSMLYHKDDTHWNALGAKTTANLLESQIRSKPTLTSR
jgi:hypothetical protein